MFFFNLLTIFMLETLDPQDSSGRYIFGIFSHLSFSQYTTTSLVPLGEQK
ncbi:hypothetical protein IJU97_01930 [bacterium]|nr:hypothetical protein [bacterium]